jgi:Protein tyrosine and serine/threonine kinase
MTGRLRLARMVNLIENFLREGLATADKKPLKDDSSPSSERNKVPSPRMLNVVPEAGPLYFKAPDSIQSHQSVEDELLRAIPLSDILISSSDGNCERIRFPQLRKMHSMPSAPPSTLSTHSISSVKLPIRINPSTDIPFEVYTITETTPEPPMSLRERRPLVNRRGMSDLDRDAAESVDDFSHMDYLTVPSAVVPSGAFTETRVVPLIPFDELMLIESIGTGRVSTIYRAAWRRNQAPNNLMSSGAVQMVALKVAMVNPSTGDTSHIDELRREADIAARLQHPNICDLVGVAADPECFCLAYEFCEGGSLLSLLTNHSRYYEYLPIALDIAQGMAFLHKKSIIHRDLKPSNILLTRDHRAKISDFGMSINNHGQELTAETGTYRYMAPEVIRHESYSSNADVYSFGICLWQLITREIPFSTMTPIQAAYAVAEGHRPDIPSSTPLRLQEIIRSCWDHDSQRRPSFTYVAMALADYAKMAFSPANVGTLTLQIANEIVATVEGNSTVNVDFSTPVAGPQPAPIFATAEADVPPPPPPTANYFNLDYFINDSSGNLGLEIE